MTRWLAIASLGALACSGPKPDPIEGDVAAVIARGIGKGTGSFDHGAWDRILSRYARDGGRRFDYAGLKKDEEAFASYLDSLAGAELETLGEEELEALFINAYNAHTVRTILDHVSEDGAYALGSIREIEDVFGRKEHVVGGFRLSLDNMEHNILRPFFRDPRIHFAVNCASISCPPLPLDAFEGERLDEQLEQAARNVLASPDYVSLEDGVLVLTKILDWYGSDFTNPEYRGAEASVPAFVARYAAPDVRRHLEEHPNVEVRFRDYDWSLNRP